MSISFEIMAYTMLVYDHYLFIIYNLLDLQFFFKMHQKVKKIQ